MGAEYTGVTEHRAPIGHGLQQTDDNRHGEQDTGQDSGDDGQDRDVGPRGWWRGEHRAALEEKCPSSVRGRPVVLIVTRDLCVVGTQARESRGG